MQGRQNHRVRERRKKRRVKERDNKRLIKEDGGDLRFLVHFRKERERERANVT